MKYQFRKAEVNQYLQLLVSMLTTDKSHLKKNDFDSNMIQNKNTAMFSEGHS